MSRNIEQALAALARLPESRQTLEQGVSIAGTRGVSFLMPLLTSHLGHARALSGHRQEGLALLDQAQHDAKSAGRTTPRVAIWAQEMPAQVHLASGRVASAAAAQDALDASRRIRLRGGEARILKTLGDVAASSAAPDFDRAQRSASMARPSPWLRSSACALAAHSHLGLGKLYRRTGERAQAHEHITTATTMYRDSIWSRRRRR